MRNIIIAALAATLLLACDRYDPTGFFASPSAGVEKRFAESEAMAEPDDIYLTGTEDYTVLYCGDVHYGESADNLRTLLRSATDTDTRPLLIVINGDLTDRDGGLREVRRIIDGETIPGAQPYIFTSIGNHDLYFNQWETYRELFGRSSYSFAVRMGTVADLFICLDTGNAQLGRRQKEWLERLLREERDRYRHCTIFTHTNLWLTNYSQFPTGSMPTQETVYLAGLAAEHGVELFVQSHDHHRDERCMDGVRYVTLDAIEDGAANASYLETVYGKNITYRFIEL